MTNDEAILIMKCAIDEVEWEYPLKYAAAFEKAIKALKQEPRKHGKWNVVGHEIMCSECGCYNFEWEFCPHCGADMREVSDD